MSANTGSISSKRRKCSAAHFLFARTPREDYGEKRWIGIGMIQGRVAFVAFAECPNDTIRIISLRKADHEERKEYEKAIQDGLGAN